MLSSGDVAVSYKGNKRQELLVHIALQAWILFSRVAPNKFGPELVVGPRIENVEEIIDVRMKLETGIPAAAGVGGPHGTHVHNKFRVVS